MRTDEDVGTTEGVVATKVRVPAIPSMGLDRLDARLEAAWGHRLGLVVAPAGSGKTSLLARFAARAPGPVGWYRAEGWDSGEAALVRHIEAALSPGLGGITGGWKSVADIANALAAWRGERVLLVVDDLHTLEGSAAEAALERLIDYAPSTLLVVVASRVPPRFNLPRLRVSGDLLELSGDDLRFRSWEVEQLFRDFYEEPLPPQELARLAHRTEGWAAGLQLFHLATRGRPPEERRRLLSELGPSSRLAREMRDYLARNVLDQLGLEMRAFLVETSVLGRLQAELCDRLLDRTDSREMLDELERRRLFTYRLAEDGWYRYHEVLRSHLQTVLLEQVGPAGLRDRFRAAGELLMQSGVLAEAVEAACRGEDWDRVSRLLGRNGQEVADGPTSWLDAVPPAVVANDPWLLLAHARRLRAAGRLREATDSYRRAERLFGSSDPGSMCRVERGRLEPWLDGGGESRLDRSDPVSLARSAIARDPLAAAREAEVIDTPEGGIAAGIARLLAGHVASARRDLLHAAERADASRQAQLIAALGAGVAGLLMGQRHASIEVEGAVAAAETTGFEWVARLGRAALALTGSPDAVREAGAVATASRGLGLRWGEAVAGLCVIVGSLGAGRPSADVDDLVELLRSLDAGVLEVWARAAGSLAAVRTGGPEALAAITSAEALARAAGVPGASVYTNVALAEAAEDAERATEFQAAAAAIARETGLLIPARSARQDELLSAGNGHSPADGPLAMTQGAGKRVGGHADGPLVRIAPIDRRGPRLGLLGGFELRLAGGPVDLATVRPRARALLRLLALHVGASVHHETIEAMLWPEADAGASSRNLHVAVAALRRVLEPAAGRGEFRVLRRDGDAYRLVLPEGTAVDIVEFEAEMAAGRSARDRGDHDEAARAFQAALELYRGDLLPEDGPAEWVAERRDHFRLTAVEAAHGVAEIHLRRGDPAAAARVATAGLRIERYDDGLWRLLIRARDEAGDQGAATRARSGYDRMLSELGVTATTG